MEKIRADVEEESVSEQIIIHGHVSDMRQRLLDIDILMLTSDHEGLPMVILECMAMKVPIIARKVGGIPDALGGGSCGDIVDSDRPKDFANALLERCSNPKTLCQNVNTAYRKVLSDFTSDVSARKYFELYRSITQ